MAIILKLKHVYKMMLKSNINVFMFLRYYVATILKCTDDITFSSFTKITD